MKIAKIMPVAAMLLVALISAETTQAEDAGKHGRLFLSNEFGAMVSPIIAAADTVELSYRYYYTDSKNILFKGNYAGFGVSDSLSPATNSVGAFVQIEPLAILNVRVQYDYLRYFGAFSSVMTFPSRYSDYSSDALQERTDNDEALAASGTRFIVAPTFQIMLGRFVVMDTLTFQWYDIDINENDYFYEPAVDTLLEDEDYIFSNQAIGGVIVRKKDEKDLMIVGSRYVYSRFEGGMRQRQELDGVFVWMMGEKRWFMENPMLMVAVGGYLQDRYHEKDVFAGGMFTFEYTLFSAAKKNE